MFIRASSGNDVNESTFGLDEKCRNSRIALRSASATQQCAVDSAEDNSTDSLAVLMHAKSGTAK